MSEVTVDPALVRWSVDGASADADAAVAALADRPLLLLLHGYGSHEGDLIGLAEHLPRGFVCASPRAPLAADSVPGGFAWAQIRFDQSGRAVPEPDVDSFEGTPAHRAAEAVLDWLDALEARASELNGRGVGTVALLGFSQGGCTATSLMRLRPERFAAGVVCSGFVAPGFGELDVLLSEVRPPVFWGRGDQDPVIDAAHIETTADWLPRHCRVESHVYPGLGHSIDVEELFDIDRFLHAHVLDDAERA